MTLGETMRLGPGLGRHADRLADEPVDLLVNGKPIARGEVVVIDEQFGLRITEVNGAEHASAGSGRRRLRAGRAAAGRPAGVVLRGGLRG